MAKLERLKKPKGLKGLPGLGKKVKQQPLPKLDTPTPKVASFVDEELANLTRALGDERLAKKILKLQEKFPDASKLELTIMEWLDRKRINYVFQQWVLGGRILKGGQVLDFAIDMGVTIMVLEAQGNYWHTRRGNPATDEAQRFALLGLTLWGKKIRTVIEVWESKIMQPNRALREQTMQLAMQGIQTGR